MGKIPLSPCLLVVHSKVFNVHESSFEFEYFDRFFWFCFTLVEINTKGNSNGFALIDCYITTKQISYSVNLSLNWNLALFHFSKKPLELQHV